MKKVMFVLLILSSCVYAEGEKLSSEKIFYAINALAEKESKPEKIRNMDDALFACSEIGSKCESFLLQCFPKDQPFTCLTIEYIKIEIAKERCGLINYEFCYEENNRLFHTFLFQISLPNNKNPRWKSAFKECDLKVPQYSVKSKVLRLFRDKVIKESKLDSNAFNYIVQEDYNKCFREHLDGA